MKQKCFEDFQKTERRLGHPRWIALLAVVPRVDRPFAVIAHEWRQFQISI